MGVELSITTDDFGLEVSGTVDGTGSLGHGRRSERILPDGSGHRGGDQPIRVHVDPRRVGMWHSGHGVGRGAVQLLKERGELTRREHFRRGQALVGVLDFQTARALAQHLDDLFAGGCEFVGHTEGLVLEHLP